MGGSSREKLLAELRIGCGGPRAVRAPRGTELHCRGWHQEAALRMLCNNLDPENAENPDELIVYGGTGKAARNWPCFDALVQLPPRPRGRRDRFSCSRENPSASCAPTACPPAC